MSRRQVTETDMVKAWNWYHPKARRPLPPRVLRERIPTFADDMDGLLAVYILQARLEDQPS